MLSLHTSNRLEELAAHLATITHEPLASPFQPEIVVVQSQGMARWLKLQLAERHGICSNCQFPFPKAFSSAAFHAVMPEWTSQAGSYDAEVLVWQVMKQLPAMLNQPGFEPVRSYLAGDTDARKRFQLSQQIANVLDQYLVFRPALILDWEKSPASGWQAQLWREISLAFRREHPAALQARFLQVMTATTRPFPKLPERLTVFGISALPPFYLTMLAALARQIPVHLFLLEPCREFWGYIRSEGEQEMSLKQAGRGALDAEALHLEKGNRLLASMGKLGRDFLLLVQAAGDWQENDTPLFQEPNAETLLAAIQSDILNLRDRGQDETARLAIAATDDSVQVHSCHSPLRELEVLHDHLLAWFQKDPTLAPGDVLVMIPEIEKYAPLIHGVFDSPENDNVRIPFSVADRATRTQSHLIETFLALLDLAQSRLPASAVLALLESAPLRQKFDLAESDLELIRHWVEAVRIRWGCDQEQRVALGLPPWAENTWHHGLQRLLLGYAMAGGGDKLFAGVLPYDDVEGQAAELLGRFLEFTRQLFDILPTLAQERSLDRWVITCQTVLETFFATGDAHAAELQILRRCLEKLRDCGERAGFDEAIGIGVVLEQLTRDLSEDHFAAGYLTGGMTFCALKPMRSIPAKIVCLLGMNDSAFPRSSPQLSFDLLAAAPQLGDRSSREDDRYLFLETLISARQRLYISYVGQSIRDNRVAPPSVVVSELLDYISQGFDLPGQKVIEDLIMTKHRLQAFSPAYFTGGRLFSYSRENLQASQASQPEKSLEAAFISAPLSEPEPERRRVSLRTLSEFFCHPARFLANKRLGMALLRRSSSLEEREPFTIDGLERYALETELLELKLNGQDLPEARDRVRSSGRLPANKAGDANYAQVCRDVDRFYKQLKPHVPGHFDAPMSCELIIGKFTVSGHFSRISPAGLLFYRPAKIKSVDLVRAWLEHLLWNAARLKTTTPQSAQSHLIGKDATWTLRPLTEPGAVLSQLLALYWTGLAQPLKFFPKTSFAFAEADFKALKEKTGGRAKRTPLQWAGAVWEGDAFSGQGESQDDYISQFFRDRDPLDEEFQAIARTVFHPLLENAEAIKP